MEALLEHDMEVAPSDFVWGYGPDGTPVTEADVQWSVRNAEAGFPGVTPRPVGHPLVIADQPAVVVQFRIDRTKLQRLDARAHAERMSRSEMLRVAVDKVLAATGN